MLSVICQKIILCQKYVCPIHTINQINQSMNLFFRIYKKMKKKEKNRLVKFILWGGAPTLSIFDSKILPVWQVGGRLLEVTSCVVSSYVMLVLTPKGHLTWMLSLFNWSKNTIKTKRALIMINPNTEESRSSFKSFAIRACNRKINKIGSFWTIVSENS